MAAERGSSTNATHVNVCKAESPGGFQPHTYRSPGEEWLKHAETTRVVSRASLRAIWTMTGHGAAWNSRTGAERIQHAETRQTLLWHTATQTESIPILYVLNKPATLTESVSFMKLYTLWNLLSDVLLGCKYLRGSLHQKDEDLNIRLCFSFQVTITKGDTAME
ncbi:hypothetical protein P4O66_001111 [Electrophorus voltai]|uniref:Uncharacterized protein n=1 Tax=Electrophorus voltai TaxID=2609070 RepID=A0AAD8ZCT8_9TELE|nr:hypothetical protein P4O66_001111 [Electrophorus voltai]